MKSEQITNERAIQVLLQKFHEVEQCWNDSRQRKMLLLELRNCLASLDEAENTDIPFITRLHKHINAEISLEQLWTLIVPVEREHARTNIKDEDFLIFSKDSEGESGKATMPVTAVVDNIRSSFNIGGIFRTSECAGIDGIHLCGYTATPENPKVLKAAMNTTDEVPWQSSRTIQSSTEELKSAGRTIYALETTDTAKQLHDVEVIFPCAILLGNERFGLSAETVAMADEVVSIPVYGKKNSLNVVSAFSIAAYEFRRQWNSHAGNS